jgi:hypothetical protein
MTSDGGATKPLPVVLAPVTDELLSSWIARHAAFYGVVPLTMLRHGIPDASSLRAIDTTPTPEQANLLAHLFRCEPADIRRMTFADLSKGAGRLVAAKSIQRCSTCAAKNEEAGSESAILRSWLQAWRVTCPICSERLSTVGEGGFPGADFGSPFGHLWNDALRGERLVDDAAERGIWTWAQPIDIVRLLLIRRDPKPIDPERWIAKPRLLDVVIPGLDRFLAEQGTAIPTATKLIMQMSLRPALLAGVAIVERSGPSIVADLHSRTIGAYHSQFGIIAASMLSKRRPNV